MHLIGISAMLEIHAILIESSCTCDLLYVFRLPLICHFPINAQFRMIDWFFRKCICQSAFRIVFLRNASST